MNKWGFILRGWLVSMVVSPVVVAAENPSPAEILSRVMPPPIPAVGFEDSRSLSDFVRRSRREKDVAVRALSLSSLGRADIDGDGCLTPHEYGLHLATWRRWRASQRADMVRAIEGYRSLEPMMSDEAMRYTARLLRRARSLGEMHLLKRLLIMVPDENGNKSIDIEELERFEDTWRAYLQVRYPAVNAHLDGLVGRIGKCVVVPGQKADVNDELQPLLRAREVAAEIQKLLPGLSSYYHRDGVPGIGAFYAELFRHTGQELHLKQALTLVEKAVDAYRKSGSQNNTLIEGSTGIAFSALAAYRSTGEKRFLEIAEELAAEIGAARDNEYAFGAAGIGIFMLDLARVTGKAAWRERALEMGDYLRKTVVRANGKAKWKFDAIGMFTVGFGHGVAGIGYFFAHLYRVTQDPLYKTLAVEAGNYVLSLADRDESGGYHWAFYDPMFRFGNSYQWSHGSAGIGHLFIALDQIDPENRWKDGLAGSIASTLRDGPNFRGIDGSCVRSGQGDLLLEAYYATGNEDYFREALRFGAMLAAEEGARQKDNCGAGYVYGLAGVGYYYLRLSSPRTVDLPFQVYVRPSR